MSEEYGHADMNHNNSSTKSFFNMATWANIVTLEVYF